MDEYLSQLVVALLHTPFIGFGSWLKWQTMKTGTIIPAGLWTQKHGRIAGWAIQLFAYMNFIFEGTDPFGWHLIVVFLLIWFVSGWIATLIERKLYQTEDNLDLISYAAESYGKSLRPEQLQELMDGFAPQWWIRLMSWSWREKLTARINERLMDESGEDAH